VTGGNRSGGSCEDEHRDRRRNEADHLPCGRHEAVLHDSLLNLGSLRSRRADPIGAARGCGKTFRPARDRLSSGRR
jgi:hypothetical protein